MTVFEFAVTYAVCWWLVLFMVLPHQVAPPVVPGKGHAPSAPENPRLGKKIRWTTLIAVLPAVALYFIVDVAKAKAEESIYHVGSKCKPLAPTAASDVNARDGYATGGKKVKPATMDNGNSIITPNDKVDIPLWIPSSNYVAPGTGNVDLSQSSIRPGTISVGMDGSTEFNGKNIAPQDVYPEGCEDKSMETTK